MLHPWRVEDVQDRDGNARKHSYGDGGDSGSKETRINLISIPIACLLILPFDHDEESSPPRYLG